MLIFIILDIYVYSVLFHKVVDKSYINSAIEYRDKYSEITDIINKNVIKNEKILLVSQEDIGYDYWTIRFILRPAYVECDGLSWSFSNDIKENDYYSINISARDFLNRLLENEYDYVLLFRINDYFVKEYKYLFTDETKILENRIYRLDKDIKKLVLCD